MAKRQPNHTRRKKMRQRRSAAAVAQQLARGEFERAFQPRRHLRRRPAVQAGAGVAPSS
jgi:hypothetical protein